MNYGSHFLPDPERARKDVLQGGVVCWYIGSRVSPTAIDSQDWFLKWAILPSLHSVLTELNTIYIPTDPLKQEGIRNRSLGTESVVAQLLRSRFSTLFLHSLAAGFSSRALVSSQPHLCNTCIVWLH